MIFRRRKKKEPRALAGELMPPEGVPLKLRIAGIGVRIAAQITDVAITLVASGSILILFAALRFTDPQTLLAIGALLFFLIRIPYYVFSELVWNGQTLGKRLMKIKVVSHDGGSLTTHALVLRNLMKEAEIFLPATLLFTLNSATPVASGVAFGWIVIGLLVPLMNRHRRRLGDLMAGTHVIHLPVPVLLKDLANEMRVQTEKRKPYAFLSHQLDHYGAFELQTLEDLLRAQNSPPVAKRNRNQQATIAALVETIRKKIKYADTVPSKDNLLFLRAFYNAQRQHLEQRQLFGDRRKNKHHVMEDDIS